MDERHRRGEGQHPPVERDGRAAAVDDHGLQPARRPQRDEDGTAAAGRGEQRGLQHDRPNQLQARGAERGADGELPRPIDGPREQEVGQVRARDEQHAPGQAEEHGQQGAAGRARCSSRGSGSLRHAVLAFAAG